MKEFDLINTFFAELGAKRKDVDLGVGDDGAVLNIPDGNQLVVSTDTLNQGVHFFSDTSAKAIAHRAFATNLSDMAAMGATPAWASVALSMPDSDSEWVKEFAQSIHEIASYYNVEVIGGDTTRGPLSVTVSMKGLVPKGKYLTRNGAKGGDWIYVTGTLGDAAAAIESIKGNLEIDPETLRYLMQRFEAPTPRVGVGEALRGVASAAIDISDGLVADIKHILKGSNVGAAINVEAIPISLDLRNAIGDDEALRFALSYGDDYELLFTVPEENKGVLDIALNQYGLSAVCIGQIQAGNKLTLMCDNTPFVFNHAGYQHFS